jgi:hypothetical protein
MEISTAGVPDARELATKPEFGDDDVTLPRD